MSQELVMTEDMELHQITTELATVVESLKNLTLQVGEIKSELREMRGVQQERISSLEKDVSILKEKVGNLEWMYKLVLGFAVSGLLGAILAMIIKP